MTLKVHVLDQSEAPDARRLAELRALLDPAVQVSSGPDLPSPADFHVLVTGRPQRAHLLASPNLRMVIIPYAGAPETTRDLLAEFPQVAMHNLHHNSAQTAEMALALLLAAARLLVPADAALRRGDWTPRRSSPRTTILHGQTVLILGYGAIGQHVARVCQALAMRVLAVRRHPTAPLPPDSPATVFGAGALTSLLPQADALIVTLPLTEETRGLIGAAELALLPAGALLVNVGRGPVVDEAALYQALLSDHLGAAGLDVWYRYPQGEEERSHTLPSSYPFHELENVVLSPHCGGGLGTDFTERERMRHLAQLLNAAARGEPVPNRVDLARGY